MPPRRSVRQKRPSSQALEAIVAAPPRQSRRSGSATQSSGVLPASGTAGNEAVIAGTTANNSVFPPELLDQLVARVTAEVTKQLQPAPTPQGQEGGVPPPPSGKAISQPGQLLEATEVPVVLDSVRSFQSSLAAEQVTSHIQPSTRLFTTGMISVSGGLPPILFTQQQSIEESTRAPIHTERKPGGCLTSEKLMIAVFVEGAFIVIALVIIGMLLFKLRVKHIGDQNGRSITAKSRNQLEEPRENVSLPNPGNAARQLGLSVAAGDSGNGATLQLTAQPCIMEGGYAVLSPRTKASEGDFYAHLVPSKQEHRTSADCSETPTYANETVVREYMNV